MGIHIIFLLAIRLIYQPAAQAMAMPLPPQSSIVSLPTPRITSTTKTYPTLAPGCYFHGVLYTPNTQIEKNDCVQIICDDSAQIRRMETPCITPARPTKEITTTLGGPIPALACYFNGHFYPPDTYMGMGIDKANNSCFEAYCDVSGHVIQHHTFKCGITTQNNLEIVG